MVVFCCEVYQLSNQGHFKGWVKEAVSRGPALEVVGPAHNQNIVCEIDVEVAKPKIAKELLRSLIKTVFERHRLSSHLCR